MARFIKIFQLSIVFILEVYLATAMPPRCPQGQFLQDTTCKLCPPGTFQNETGASSCKPCPPGLYSSVQGAVGVDVCIDCPVGTFREQPGASSQKDCIPCPQEQSSPTGSRSCISCPPGTVITNCKFGPEFDFPATFAGNCLACFGSHFGSSCSISGPVKITCEDCAPGRVSTKKNSFDCEHCPKGFGASADGSQCKPIPRCPAGNSFDSSSGKCMKCSFFSFNDGTKDFCEHCPPGSMGNMRTGSTQCVPCPAGSFKKYSSEAKCESCRPGQNSFATGAQYCVNDSVPCPPNFFKSNSGACLTCTAFQRYDKKKNTCVQCPTDSLSIGGLSPKCKPCGPGMMTDPDQFYPYCVCSKGWGFVIGSGGSKCEKCPLGTANELLFSACSKCTRDTFSPKPGSDFCKGCPFGFSQPLQGQSKCVRDPPCPSGLVRKPYRGCVDLATNCPPNHLRKPLVDGLPQCEPLSPEACPGDSVPIWDDSFGVKISCGFCSKNERYVPDKKRCRRCRNNEFSQGGAVRKCTSCPKGLVQEFGGACTCSNGRRFVRGRCVRCPRGSIGFDHTDGCMPCPPGKFASNRGSTECDICPPGFFTDAPGQAACKRCPQGLVSSGIGDAGCVAPAGGQKD